MAKIIRQKKDYTIWGMDNMKELDVEYLTQQLQTEIDPLVQWRIEKQIEMIEDATRLAECQ